MAKVLDITNIIMTDYSLSYNQKVIIVNNKNGTKT